MSKLMKSQFQTDLTAKRVESGLKFGPFLDLGMSVLHRAMPIFDSTSLD